MCGICGIVSFKRNLSDDRVIKGMVRSIKHRGPDGEGYFAEDNIALGHVRLSIIDLSDSANQPMYSDDNNLVIVFNGEIFNYKDVKAEFASKYPFSTQSDTEVIIYAYQEWGEDCLHKLNGMFSFVIYDISKKILFAARDRFGIKPFYYFHNPECFLFGSEIKAILETEIVQTKINERMLYDYIVFNRTDHSEETCFKGILNLRPAHKLYLDTKTGELNIQQWYFLPDNKLETHSFEYYKNTLLERLNDSIKLHLVSDVPVGTALSGGLDSSSIVTLMREQMTENKPLYTFSAVYDKSWEKDEKKYIEELEQHLKIETCFVQPSAQRLLQELDQLIYHQEEPFASASIFASWCVYSQAHNNNIKVLLNGQGADELFAYDYMAAFYFYELFCSFNFILLVRELFLFKKKQTFGTKFTFMLFAFLLLPAFLKTRAVRISNSIISTEFFNKYKNTSNFFHIFFNTKTLNDNVKNHLVYKLHHLLRVEDKNSMAFSVEARVPFLEYQLAEYSINIPSRFKVKNGETKYILKKTMQNLLPEKITNRNDKIGYETPMEKWFREPEFITLVDEMLGISHQPMEYYLNIAYIREKWEKHKTGEENNSLVVWKYLYLTRWYSIFINNSLQPQTGERANLKS